MPNLPLPPGAMSRIPQISEANRALIQAFESHAAFASQSAQRSGKVYFMWDFANRTEAMFQSILQNYPPPDTPATRGTIPNVPPASMTQTERDELKEDSVGRCMMLHSMIKDTSGKTAIMFGEAPGRGIDLGDDLKRAADAVKDVIYQSGTSASEAV
ncbi:hypothetical protein K505DRAFT_322425 [Melanomma pulvis-pyrius CBS 109.77]|uniref:Uncharacterized protein n=1 Tax=Melanomma pulvis-pyrius CBS 109.77 TaxID=1314802 RepID=A0A6A6XQ70_9PLEO|nr:hypothetical protein K505DRAFT_322425 [Melanomma pulvis-pyrius CBS 109.77]